MNDEDDEIVVDGVFEGWDTQIGVVWEKCEGILSDKMEELDIIFDGLFKKKKYEDTFWLDRYSHLESYVFFHIHVN